MYILCENTLLPDLEEEVFSNGSKSCDVLWVRASGSF